MKTINTKLRGKSKRATR